MLGRVLEPEVMDSAEEAREYDAMDHAAVNVAFCMDLLAAGAVTGRVLDVGTGTALIPIELCARAPVDIVAIDLADHMLALGKINVARAGLGPRISLEKVDAKAMPWPDATFDACISNSIVHHIPNPEAALREMWRVTRAGGQFFVRDLVRPPSEGELEALVARYANPLPGTNLDARAIANQRESFRASLHAALTLDEVSAIMRTLGMTTLSLSLTSDRHWTLAGKKS